VQPNTKTRNPSLGEGLQLRNRTTDSKRAQQPIKLAAPAEGNDQTHHEEEAARFCDRALPASRRRGVGELEQDIAPSVRCSPVNACRRTAKRESRRDLGWSRSMNECMCTKHLSGDGMVGPMTLGGIRNGRRFGAVDFVPSMGISRRCVWC